MTTSASNPRAWAIRPSEVAEYECYKPPRKVVPLINADLCGARQLQAGLYKLAPGDTSKNDIHEEEELYYVISGRARLVVNGEAFTVEPGMAIFVPPGCWHESTNIGNDELRYFWVFAPPPPGPAMYTGQDWVRHEPARADNGLR